MLRNMIFHIKLKDFMRLKLMVFSYVLCDHFEYTCTPRGYYRDVFEVQNFVVAPSMQ